MSEAIRSQGVVVLVDDCARLEHLRLSIKFVILIRCVRYIYTPCICQPFTFSNNCDKSKIEEEKGKQERKKKEGKREKSNTHTHTRTRQ